MKKNKFVFVMLLCISLLISITSTKEVYSNTNYLFELDIVESSTGLDTMSANELSALIDPDYHAIKFDIYLRSIGENRALNGIQAGWVLPNSKTSYLLVDDGDTFVQASIVKKNVFTLAGSNEDHLALADAGLANVNGFMFTEENIRIASVYIKFEESFDVSDYFELSLDFINYPDGVIELTGIYEYPLDTVKVNGFETTQEEPDTLLKTLTVGSKEITLNNDFIYEVNLTYDESKLGLSDIVKYTLNKSKATASISKSTPSEIKVDDEIYIDVTDTTQSGTQTTRHKIVVVGIGDALTTLQALNFNSDGYFSLDKAFNKDILNYELTIPASRQSHGFVIRPVSESIHAVIDVKLDNLNITAQNGTYRINNLSKGNHTLQINVLNNNLTKTYEIKINQQAYESTATIDSFTVIDQSNNTKAGNENEIIYLPENASSYRLDLNFIERTVKQVSFETSIYMLEQTIDGTRGNLTKDASNLNKFKYTNLIPIKKGERHTLTLTITAEDNTVHTYIYVIERSLSTNTELKNVLVTEANNQVTVNLINNEYNYTIKDNEIDKVTVNVNPKDNEFSTVYVRKNGSIIGNTILVSNLSEGKHIYEIYVVAQDGFTTQSYPLSITKLSSDTSLSFKVRQFGQNDVIYTHEDFELQGNNFVLANIPYDLSNLSFEVIADHQNAKAEKTSGYGTFSAKANRISGTINFTSILSQTVSFTIRITAENTLVTTEYEITLTRVAAKLVDTLSELTISNQSVNGFVANIKPSTNLGLTIINPSSLGQAIFIEGIVSQNELTSKISYEYKLASAQNYITGQSINFERAKTYDVRVTVESEAKTKSIYQFQFVVASTNNEISSIKLFNELDEEINLGYDKNTLEYTLSVPATLSKINIKTVLLDQYAKVVTGADQLGNISLNPAGRNTVIEVYALSEANTKSQTYRITLVRGSYRTSAQINTLNVKLPTTDYISLNPVFSSSTLNYTLRIDNIHEYIDIEATLKENGETFIGGAKTYKERIYINSGESKTIQLIVIAEDGQTRQTYTIQVQRANQDAKLKSIEIDGNKYNESLFVNNVLNLGSIQFSKSSFEVYVELNDNYATYTTNTQLINNYWQVTQTGQLELTITITAQDNKTKQIYRIRVNREIASTDATLKTLIFESNKGNLLDNVTPVKTQNSETYHVIVDRSIVLTNVIAEVNHLKATINHAYINKSLNPGGEKLFTITVTAEDGKTVMNYYISITQKNNDASIDQITINDELIDLNKQVKVYDLGTFNYSNRTIDLSVILSDQIYASLLLNNQVFNKQTYDLVLNQTTFTLHAKAEDNTLGELYTFKYVLNPMQSDNLLDTLKLTSTTTNFIDLINVEQSNFVINLSNEFNEDKLVLVAIVNKNLKTITQVTNINDVTLPITSLTKDLELVFNQDGSINKIISITVKAEDGSQKVYTIQITRGTQLSSNKEISSIEIYDLNDELIKTFTTFTQMNLNVTYQTSGVKVKVNLIDQKASVTLDTIYLLIPNQSKTIEFKVEAEDNSLSDKYVITILRENPSHDHELLNLEVLDKDGNNLISFKKDQKQYEIKLNRSHTSVDVLYEKANQYQVILGSIDNQNLLPGLNRLQVFVTAEDGINKSIYTITIYILDDSNQITEITLNSQKQFVTDDLTYNFGEVSFDTNKVNIDFKTSLYATKFGSGTFDLKVGINEFTIYAVSEDNQIGITYTLMIKRLPADTNNLLQSILIYDELNGKYLTTDQVFRPNQTSYVITLDSKTIYQNITIDGVAESNLSTITGLGTYQLIETDGVIFEVINISVKAQDDSIKTYEIKFVKVNQTTLSSDYEVYDIEIIGNNGVSYFIDLFDQTRAIQEKIILPFEVNTIHLNVILAKGATLYSQTQKIYMLQAGKNLEISILSQAEDKTLNPLTYILTIERMMPDNNNYLKDLSIDGETINDFKEDKLAYEITLDSAIYQSIDISALAVSNHARIVGSGMKQLVNGLNTFSIMVYAENNEVLVYNIKVYLVSYDNNLLDLNVLGYELSFNEDIYTYNIQIPYNVSDITITGDSNLYATIIGIGNKTNLIVGENKFEIYVLSQANTKGKTYEIIVNRLGADDDATLKHLIVKDTLGNILPFTSDFSKEVNEYIIMLQDKTVMSVLIEAEASSATSTVYQTGLQRLEGIIDGKYHTILSVTVISQSEKENKYTISFYREVSLDDMFEITNINLVGNNGVNYLSFLNESVNLFNPTNKTYNILVPHSLTSLNLEVVTLGNTIGAGQKLFNDNEEIIYTFYVESKSKLNRTEVYTIIIRKEEVSNHNLLDSLQINNEAINNFDPLVNNYEISIDKNNPNQILITGSTTAHKVSGFGTYIIQQGKNVFAINVTAENGVINTYTLTINYIDTNALLNTLVIKESIDVIYSDSKAKLYESFIFNPENFEYEIYVSPETRFINIQGSAQNINGAQVLGFGTYRLSLKTEKINIQVTAQDQTTTEVYSITVHKEIKLSNDSKLNNLIIKGYDIEFNQATYQYKIKVTHDTKDVNIYATTSNHQASVSIVGYEMGNPSSAIDLTIDDLVDGNNVLLIKVVAEDGSISYYRLNVEKERQENLIVVVLLILAIMLWVITVLALLIRRIRNKQNKKERLIV